jgi:hypothetical protein
MGCHERRSATNRDGVRTWSNWIGAPPVTALNVPRWQYRTSTSAWKRRAASITGNASCRGWAIKRSENSSMLCGRKPHEAPRNSPAPASVATGPNLHQAFLRRRSIAPTPSKPAPSKAMLPGSGTFTVMSDELITTLSTFMTRRLNCVLLGEKGSKS